MRHGRYKFAPLSAPPKEQKFIAFDTETRPGADGKGSYFVMGCIFDGKEFKMYRDRKAMIRSLFKYQRAGTTAWACNLEFDLKVLFPESDWPVWYRYFGGLLKGADGLLRDRTVKRKGKTVSCREWLHFADTMNHWPGGVAEYGKLIGLEKLDMPQVVPTRELETYCARDTEIVYRMVERSQRIYNDLGCELKGTVASSAKDLFRRRFFDEDHSFWPLSKQELDMFRLGYYGARTEAFRKGLYQNVYMGDVVSMYPYVMQHTKMPVIETRLPISKRIKDGLEGMACVDLEVGDEYYPPLPYRHDKLYFPIGKWTGVYPLNELRYAEEHGAKISKVHFCVQYERSEYIFKDYVEALFPLKAEAAAKGDKLWERTVKLFLNSLYGVFATGYDSETIAPSWDDGASQEEAPLSIIEMGGHKRFQNPKNYPASTNFMWPMYITAEARILLHSLLEKYRGFYCDTDSVATFQEIRHNKNLGKLDLKYFSSEMEILAPKIYRDDMNIKIKGVPKSSIGVDVIKTADGKGFDMLSLKDMKRIGMTYYYQKVTRFRESLRRDLVPNTWSWIEKHLRVNEASEKRHFYRNGQSRPLDVEEVRKRHIVPGLSQRINPSLRIVYRGCDAKYRIA